MCGDVGQDKFESVFELQKGVNFGWNAREAFSCFKQDLCRKIGIYCFCLAISWFLSCLFVMSLVDLTTNP